MRELYEKRLDSLRSCLSEKQAALITNEVNIGYFTGFFHSEGYLLVTTASAHLLVDFRYEEAAREKVHGCEVICFQMLSESLLALLTKQAIQCVAVEAQHLTLSRSRFFQEKLNAASIELLTDDSLDRQINELRLIKDKTEHDKIAAAQRIAEKAYLAMLDEVRPGVTERALAAKLQYEMKRGGAEDVSFDLITIAGSKTSLPHGVPGDYAIREGDFLTCDFGAVYEGYHSDTTRTVAVGFATDPMREIYDIVLQAQLTALQAIRPGVKCSEVDKAARDVIEAAGYGKYFGHSTGHGVGLAIHEQPAVSARCDTVLQAGMVITDEPGIYLPQQFGVRIEDMLCVTDEGYLNFVDLPKELIIL